MAVKIRMQRHGSKKRPFYFIVAANSTATRDGRFIEKLGTYNPLTVPATVELNRERALDWLLKGAQPTNTVRRILSFKGVLYMKHLQRGVGLGLFDQAAAEEKFTQWEQEHRSSLDSRQESDRKAKIEKRAGIAQESARRVEEKNAARRAALEAELAAANAENEEAAAEATETEETPSAPEETENKQSEEKPKEGE